MKYKLAESSKISSTTTMSLKRETKHIPWRPIMLALSNKIKPKKGLNTLSILYHIRFPTTLKRKKNNTKLDSSIPNQSNMMRFLKHQA